MATALLQTDLGEQACQPGPRRSDPRRRNADEHCTDCVDIRNHEHSSDLDDELKQRDRRIAELKDEIDEQRDLNQRLAEALQEWEEIFEAWKEGFEMRLGDDGVWTWSRYVVAGDEWREKYIDLSRKWTKLVRDYNNLHRGKCEDSTLRDRGRTIAATPEQRAIIFESRDEGRSLRECADDAGVGLQTVRTVLGKINGTDRTSLRLSKYFMADLVETIDRKRIAKARARKRTRDGLPKQLHNHSKKTRELIKEAKGLGRGATL